LSHEYVEIGLLAVIAGLIWFVVALLEERRQLRIRNDEQRASINRLMDSAPPFRREHY
jgi:hypothetical protein